MPDDIVTEETIEEQIESEPTVTTEERIAQLEERIAQLEAQLASHSHPEYTVREETAPSSLDSDGGAEPDSAPIRSKFWFKKIGE